MCGRYRLSRRKQIIEEHFFAKWDELEWHPSYNIAPDVTGDLCTRWNERESTWRKSGSCPSRGTNRSKS